MARQGYRNPDCSVFLGNLDQRVTEELLWELLLQAGPVKSVRIPCDKETGKPKAFGFVEFSSSTSAHYACELLDGIKLFDRPLTVRPSQRDGETANWAPTNQMSASNFYRDFYNKCDELKRRPQSEPRISRWQEENFYRRNNSFTNQPLNRSLSSPAYMAYTPQWQQMLARPQTPPARNVSQRMGSLLSHVQQVFNQTPPSRSYQYR